eukprot:3961107-Pleurochrysis_carterae.AAC.1
MHVLKRLSFKQNAVWSYTRCAQMTDTLEEAVYHFELVWSLRGKEFTTGIRPALSPSTSREPTA